MAGPAAGEALILLSFVFGPVDVLVEVSVDEVLSP